MSEAVEAPIEEEGGEAPVQEEEAQEGEVQEEGGEEPAQDEAAEVPAQEGEEAAEYPPAEEANYPADEGDQENRPQIPLAKRLQRNPYYSQFLTSLQNLITYEVKIYGHASAEAKQHLTDLIAALSADMWAADERASQVSSSQKRPSQSNASITKRSHTQSIRGQSDPEFLSMVLST